MQRLPPVSNSEPKGSISLFSLLSLSQRKEGSFAHKFAGGKGEDNGVDQASCEEVSPYLEANDRKAKLLKFEQSILIFFKLSSLNDHALYGKPVRGGTNS